MKPTILLGEAIIELKKQGLMQYEIAEKLSISMYKLCTISKELKIRWDRGARLGNKNAQISGLGRTTIKRLTRKVVAESNRCLFTCERCQIKFPEELARHHKDRNRANNKANNLEVLCQSCHALEHINERERDNETGIFTG